MSGSTVIPCLKYRNAPAMMEWLCNVIGFEKKAVYTDDEGRVMHAELTLGNGMIMLGSDYPAARETPWGQLIRQPDEVGGYETQSPCIYVQDPDAVLARVKANGGVVVLPIEDKPYGARDFTCRDPEGHLWNIGNYNAWSTSA